MKNIRIEFSKFTIVGGVNFVFTFVLFYFCLRIIKINYLVAIVLVSLAGMVLTYYLNHVWVFKPEQEVRFKARFFKYVVAGFSSIGLNVVLLHYVVVEVGFDPFFGQLALIPLIVIFNFSTAKFWSLRSGSS
ncbi:GtrA family protein [Paralcaligenes ureilyticus]|uniref:GtrA family protein n=1 Tax=Paralcaligenes ureilyticus TaxID=627131 RepID=UPI0014048C97